MVRNVGAAVAALHEIADADEMAADPAGDRRQHMSELDIELGRLQRAFGLHLGGVRRLQCLAALVDDLIRRRRWSGPGSAPRSSSRLASSALARASDKLAVRLRCHRLERAGVDDVEQVARLDDVAVLELDMVDEAADPGADLDLLDRLEAAGELVPIGDGALGRLRDGHRRRRGGRAAAPACRRSPPGPTASRTASGAMRRQARRRWRGSGASQRLSVLGPLKASPFALCRRPTAAAPRATEDHKMAGSVAAR